MEFLHSRWILRIALGVASAVCCAIAASWFRATYQMYRSGKARPLPLPFPVFMFMDIFNASRKTLGSRLPPEIESRLGYMRFESIISWNYLKAFTLLIFGILAADMVYNDLHRD